MQYEKTPLPHINQIKETNTSVIIATYRRCCSDAESKMAA